MVLVHTGFPPARGYTLSIATIAVPIFFMVSGFYAYGPFDAKRLGKKIAPLGKITAFSVALYVGFHVLTEGVSAVFGGIQLYRLRDWLFFNKPFLSEEHIWFLYCLIYIYIAWYILNRLHCVKPIRYFVYGLAFLMIAYREATVLFPIYSLPYFTARSVYGLAMFLLGNQLRENREKVVLIKNRTIGLLFLVGFCLSVAEAYILNRFFWREGQFIELMYGSALMAVSLFLWTVKNPGKDGILSRIGRKDSLTIYVIHWLIMDVINSFSIPWAWWGWVFPFAVYALCVLISCGLRFLLQTGRKLVKTGAV